MKWKEISKYLGIFILGAALIVVYKTFDNFGAILDWFHVFLRLLTPFFIGFAIAYLLYIPCKRIESLLTRSKFELVRTRRRGIAVAIIYLAFLALLTLLLVAILPALIKSISDFAENLPSILQSLIDWINSLNIDGLNEVTINGILSSDMFSVQNLVSKIDFGNVNKYAQGVKSFGTGVFNWFMGFIISVYILMDRKNLKDSFSRFVGLYVPERTHRIAARYTKQINEFIQKYIYCMLIDACILFILSFIVMTVIGVQYAPMLALMIGLFNMIPYFGATIATVIAAIISVFTGSLMQGVIVVILLIVIQQIDANFIQPKLLSGSLNVKPFWVIFGIILGGGLFGVLGIFLAVPIIALLRIILLDIMDLRERKREIDRKRHQT